MAAAAPPDRLRPLRQIAIDVGPRAARKMIVIDEDGAQIQVLVVETSSLRQTFAGTLKFKSIQFGGACGACPDSRNNRCDLESTQCRLFVPAGCVSLGFWDRLIQGQRGGSGRRLL